MTDMDHGLGWRKSPPDKRDWKPEKLLGLVTGGKAEPVSWQCDVWLDQGKTNHCGGYAGAYFVATDDARRMGDDTVVNETGERIYYRAKEHDHDPGGEEGTCLRSVAKALKDFGVIDHYSITSDPLAVDKWLRLVAPVITGFIWTEGMMQKDARGFIHPTGKDMGGHASLTRACLVGSKRIRNSWGEEWGECDISDLDYAQRLREGEALLMVKRVPGRENWITKLLRRFR